MDGPLDTAPETSGHLTEDASRSERVHHLTRPPGRYTADTTGPPTVSAAIGLTRRRRADLARRARQGELVRVRRGVYLPTAHHLAQEREQWLLAEVRGVTDRFTTPFWVSHDTAALVWGCWTWHLSPFVQVTQLSNPHVERVRDPDVRRHRTALPPRDRTMLGGVPVTTLERTVVDCARSLQLERSMVVVDSALRMGADPRVIGQILEESRGRRGVVRARRAWELVNPASESPGETLVRIAAVQNGLPAPVPQVPVATPLGTFCPDLAWAELGIAIEFDGAVKYSGDDCGDPDAVRRAQARREAALVAAGWVVVRFTWDDLADPVRVGARLAGARRLVARRRRPR